MKHFSIILLLFFSLSMHSNAQTKEYNAIQWLTFEQLSDSLNTNPKKVLLFFHTDWCVYCKKMLNETFKDQKIINKINNEYYAVQFDAESIDSVKFDNTLLVNRYKKKTRGKYHEIAKLLLPKEQAKFPNTILLDKDFNIFNREDKYLSIKGLIKIL